MAGPARLQQQHASNCVVPLPLTRFHLAERSDTLNDVSFARRKAGIFFPAA